MYDKVSLPDSGLKVWQILHRNPARTLFTFSLVVNLVAITIRGNFYAVETWENGVIARNLIQGLGFSGTYLVEGLHPTSVMAPFYPYFLAAIYTIFGITPTAFIVVQLVQAVVQAGAVVLLFTIGRQIFNTSVGILAGLGLVLFPDHVFGVTIIHQLTFSTFVILLLVYGLLRLKEDQSLILAAACGGILGIATLVIPTVLYFAPIIPLWLLWRAYPSQVALRKAFKTAVIITVVSLAVVAPWTIRNYLIHDQFVLMKLVGWNFWRGNVPPAIYTGVPNNLDDAAPAVQQQVKLSSEAAANDLLLGIAVDYVVHHPIAFLTHILNNSWYFWWFPPVQEHQAAQVNILRKLIYLPLFLIGLTGIVLSLRRWRQYRLFYGLFISFTVGYSVFFILPRYRVPTIQPYLILFAGFALYQIWQRLSATTGNPDARNN